LHTPAGELFGLRALPAIAAPAPAAVSATPLAEAWDYADRYFLDRTFDGHDWTAIRAQLVDGAPADLPDDEMDKRVKQLYQLLGDKYSRALSRAEADELSKYDVTGINVNVMRRPADGALVVSAVPPKGSESERAGVRYGDVVLAINGVSMKDKSPFDALEIIQSTADDMVTLELQTAPGSERSTESLTVRLKRAFSVSSPVVSRVVRVNDAGRQLSIGYVKLFEFNAVGKRQVGTTLARMAEAQLDGCAPALLCVLPAACAALRCAALRAACATRFVSAARTFAFAGRRGGCAQGIARCGPQRWHTLGLSDCLQSAHAPPTPGAARPRRHSRNRRMRLAPGVIHACGHPAGLALLTSPALVRPSHLRPSPIVPPGMCSI
jgi:hypothetical protein